MKSLFPLFADRPEIIYLDSAATALKPQVVIDAVTAYLEEYSANVGRGLYPIAEQATLAFETSRETVASFIHALPEEIIFTSGTTGGINLAAQLLASSLKAGDNIIVTDLEHHSNFLPWKELARSKGLDFRIAPSTKDGHIDLTTLDTLIDERTRIFACTAISNVTGGINPINRITALVRKKNPNVHILIDAAQAAGHIPIDAAEWDADFIAFSGHKMYGPTGIGILFGKKQILSKLRPVIFGGGMVLDSCANETEYREAPACFEAGTQNIEGAIGLGAAIDCVTRIGIENIRKHDIDITGYAMRKLSETFGDDIHIIGPSDTESRSSLISFTLKGIHPHDLAQLLGEKGICIRAGEHCARPIHQKLQLPATARISFGIYTSEKDIDKLIGEIKNALLLFKNTKQKTQKPNKTQNLKNSNKL